MQCMKMTGNHHCHPRQPLRVAGNGRGVVPTLPRSSVPRTSRSTFTELDGWGATDGAPNQHLYKELGKQERQEWLTVKCRYANSAIILNKDTGKEEKGKARGRIRGKGGKWVGVWERGRNRERNEKKEEGRVWFEDYEHHLADTHSGSWFCYRSSVTKVWKASRAYRIADRKKLHATHAFKHGNYFSSQSYLLEYNMRYI